MMLCAKFGLNWFIGSGKEVENVTSLKIDGRTDERWTKSDQKSSLEHQLNKTKGISTFTKYKCISVNMSEINAVLSVY